VRWIALAATVGWMFLSGASSACASNACPEVGVADLQLMTANELESTYCQYHAFDQVAREYVNRLTSQGLVRSGDVAEWKECLDMEERIFHVLRARNTQPPECDGAIPKARPSPAVAPSKKSRQKH
jgi:hypothetical protein